MIVKEKFNELVSIDSIKLFNIKNKLDSFIKVLNVSLSEKNFSYETINTNREYLKKYNL